MPNRRIEIAEEDLAKLIAEAMYFAENSPLKDFDQYAKARAEMYLNVREQLI